MTQYIIAIVFFVFAVSIMGLALHFSQYKKRNSGCCGGLHCDSPHSTEKPKTCQRDKAVELAKRINAEELKLIR